MFIIIVGPDGAGKSTLARKISAQTGFEIIKRNKPESEEEKQQMYQQYCQVIMHRNNVIFDRFAYCEQVYGTVMRDKSVLSDAQVKYLESLLAMKGAIVIHCTDDIDVLWKRCKERGEAYVVDYNKLAQIKYMYDDIFSQEHLIPVVEYRIRDEQDM